MCSSDLWVVFPGCLQGRHARETGAKGCSLVHVENGQVVDVEHRVLDVIRWASCDLDLGAVDGLQQVLDRCELALEALLNAAEGRPLATRLRLQGASPVHEELQSRSHWLRQAILRLAAERFGEALWIEKLVLETSSRLDREALLATEGALGSLARGILEIGRAHV